MKKTYQIYEGSNLQEAMNNLLADGAKPAFKTLKEAWDWKQKNSPDKWINTGTYFYKGDIKPLTLKQCMNIKELYDKGGRLLFLGNCDGSGLYGDYEVSYDGRFVGVKVKK